jgi:hypothetical protein
MGGCCVDITLVIDEIFTEFRKLTMQAEELFIAVDDAFREYHKIKIQCHKSITRTPTSHEHSPVSPQDPW